MKKPEVDPEFLGLCIADKFAGYLNRYMGIAKTTRTQIVTTHGERFRRPDKVEPGVWVNKKGGNDYHHFELVKISDIKKPKK